MARERDTDTTLKQELGKRFASLTLEPEKPKEPTKQELEVKFAKLTLRPRKIKGHFNVRPDQASLIPSQLLGVGG